MTTQTLEKPFISQPSLKPGYKQTEIGIIPDDWGVIPLKKLLSQNPTYGINAPAVELVGNIPVYIRITDIDDAGYFKTENKVGVDSPFSGQYYLEKGDLVFARTGASVGKSYLYNPKDGELVYAGFLIKITPNENLLSSEYLFQCVRTKSYWDWVQVMSMRSGQPGINGTEYGQLLLPVPQPDEQKAIAEALSDADDLIASLEALISKKRDIKTATMQQLLTGKKRLPGFGVGKGYMQTDLGLIPEDWDVFYLGDLGQSIIGLTYTPNNVSNDGILVLRSSNIKGNSLDYEDTVYVNIDVPGKLITQAGDVLICVRNGSKALIGKCALISKIATGLTFGAFMSVFRSNCGEYVYLQFQSDLITKQINAHLGATINQITNKSLNSFQIPLPQNPEEQKAIESVLSDMDEELTVLEAQLDKTKAFKQGMMQELLTGRTDWCRPK